MVARPTVDSPARSSALQCRRARAARICAGVSGLGLILTSYEFCRASRSPQARSLQVRAQKDESWHRDAEPAAFVQIKWAISCKTKWPCTAAPAAVLELAAESHAS